MTGTQGLDEKGGPWEWRSRVVYLASDSPSASTEKLDAALADKTLLSQGFAVHAVMSADPGAGEYGRKPVVIVLFRKRVPSGD